MSRKKGDTLSNDIDVKVLSLAHDLLPCAVNFAEPFGLFWELLGDVTANKDGLQVDPHILH